MTGFKFKKLHLFSGGSKNKYLCRKTAELLGIPVYAGPAEATVIGNILNQAMACGIIKSENDDIREIIESSIPVDVYGEA
jgi:rhamnulokinase